MATRRANPSRKRQQLRIIGGAWRGRRIEFPVRPALRPTPDRVRETLFNWLQGSIEGSRCLDLFAGSGALGFEAASRGAASVVMVDNDPQVVDYLRGQAALLDARQVETIMTDAQSYLATAPPPFDLVFLDPPFDAASLTGICKGLEDYRILKSGARIYLESRAALGSPSLSTGWQLLRSLSAGQVGYHLAMKIG